MDLQPNITVIHFISLIPHTLLHRADYWVSNERKFCDFCKCWIADNKPSIAFHEGGKRHKENVAKRLNEISKKSAKDERAQQKVDQQLRQMEDAAMRAYAGDISRGADMTSRAIAAFNVMAGGSSAGSSSGSGAGGPSIGPRLVDYDVGDDEEAAHQRAGTVKTNGSIPGPAALPRRAIDPMMPPIDVLEEEERAKRERMRRKAAGLPLTEDAVVENSMWCEAKSDEGHTYYWNVKTNETVWEAPKEGFMTLKEYSRINEVAVRQQEIQHHQESMFMRGNADEIVAKFAREKLKERRAKPTVEEVKEKEEEQSNYRPFEEPGWSAGPLGQWKTVDSAPPKAVDLQLPAIQHDFVYVPAANVEPEPPVKKFKEKVVSSLDEVAVGVPMEFKKRKTAVKRSVRQRVDDD